LIAASAGHRALRSGASSSTNGAACSRARKPVALLRAINRSRAEISGFKTLERRGRVLDPGQSLNGRNFTSLLKTLRKKK